MKKIFFALMAFATVAMIGCSKDDDDNNAQNNEQHRSDGNNTALVEKAFTFQVSQNVSARKAGSVDVTTFVLNFIDAQRVQVERAVADVTDGDTLLYSAASQVVNYLLDENNHGAFTVSMDGTQFAFNFTLNGSDFNVILNRDTLIATATRYTAGTPATDVMAGSSWEINADLRSRVFDAAYDMINSTDFYAVFDATGNTGSMTFANQSMTSMFPNGVSVGVTYDVSNMGYLNRPYGHLTIDPNSQLGSAFSGMITGVEYVMVNSETLIIHMHITSTLASMLGIPTDISDIYVPMRRTSGVTPNPGDNPSDTTVTNVEVEGTAWQFSSGSSMSGTISFTSATSGTMHIAISGAGVDTDVPFTYAVRGNQVSITLDASDPYVAGLISTGNFSNPLIATVAMENNQISFTMMRTTVVATPMAK